MFSKAVLTVVCVISVGVMQSEAAIPRPSIYYPAWDGSNCPALPQGMMTYFHRWSESRAHDYSNILEPEIQDPNYSHSQLKSRIRSRMRTIIAYDASCISSVSGQLQNRLWILACSAAWVSCNAVCDTADPVLAPVCYEGCTDAYDECLADCAAAS